MNTIYADYYNASYKEALLYQDFIVDVCFNLLKMPICTYSSKLYQYEFGESASRVEIKQDKKYQKTGNLWIECAEKATQRLGPYVPSGIYRHDNAWLYIIGNYDTVFVFGKKMLVGIDKANRYERKENKTKTSVGFCLPGCDAEKYAMIILHPNSADKVDMKLKDMALVGQQLYQTLVNYDGNQMRLFDMETET